MLKQHRGPLIHPEFMGLTIIGVGGVGGELHSFISFRIGLRVPPCSCFLCLSIPKRAKVRRRTLDLIWLTSGEPFVKTVEFRRQLFNYLGSRRISLIAARSKGVEGATAPPDESK